MKRGIIICTGLMKSGTHSLQKMILNSVHEYDAENFMYMLLRYKRGEIDRLVFSSYLFKHFEENSYSCFIAHSYSQCLEEIYKIYPSAKYIFSFREFKSFVYSYYNHLYNRRHKSRKFWRIYHTYLYTIFGEPYTYFDWYLQLLRLPSIKSVLNIYIYTLSICKIIPRNQKYIYFLENFSECIQSLSDFICQDIKEIHSFHTPYSKIIEYILPKNYIQSCYHNYILTNDFLQKEYSSSLYVK